jgi:hypothetical protein
MCAVRIQLLERFLAVWSSACGGQAKTPETNHLWVTSKIDSIGSSYPQWPKSFEIEFWLPTSLIGAERPVGHDFRCGGIRR